MHRRIAVALFACIILATMAAAAQTRGGDALAPTGTVVEEGDGSGGEVDERAYDPRGNEAAQPERNEGNEDDLDINSWDDGTSGGASQGGN